MGKDITIQNELTRLKNAFPMHLVPEVESLFAVINAKFYHIAQWGYQMKLDGEAIEIPSRIYWDESKLHFNNLSKTQNAIAACILTRRHNGFVSRVIFNRDLQIATVLTLNIACTMLYPNIKFRKKMKRNQ